MSGLYVVNDKILHANVQMLDQHDYSLIQNICLNVPQKYACKMPHEMSAEVNMQNSVETFAKCNMDKIGDLL